MQIKNCRHCGLPPTLIEPNSDLDICEKRVYRSEIKCTNPNCPVAPHITCRESMLSKQCGTENVVNNWNKLMESDYE